MIFDIDEFLGVGGQCDWIYTHSCFAGWLLLHALTDVLFNLIWQFRRTMTFNLIIVDVLWYSSPQPCMFIRGDEIWNCHPSSPHKRWCMHASGMRACVRVFAFVVRYVSYMQCFDLRAFTQFPCSEHDIVCHCLRNHNFSRYSFHFGEYYCVCVCNMYTISFLSSVKFCLLGSVLLPFANTHSFRISF